MFLCRYLPVRVLFLFFFIKYYYIEMRNIE